MRRDLHQLQVLLNRLHARRSQLAYELLHAGLELSATRVHQLRTEYSRLVKRLEKLERNLG